jgi:hypothetical protein
VSLTKRKVNLSLNRNEMLMLLNIIEAFSWQNEAVFKYAKIDTKKKDEALWKLQVRMGEIFNENFNESYIINKMMEGDLEFPHAQ